MNHDTWKLGLNSPHFEDAPEWPPCYRDSYERPRDTQTGRFISEDKYTELREEWESDLSEYEIKEAEEQLRHDQFHTKFMLAEREKVAARKRAAVRE